jgi:serine/threonine-protein kinase
VPARLRRVLLRGLAADPARRHDGMKALLAELASATSTARRRLAAGIGAALLIAGAAVSAGSGALRDPCAQPERELAGAWDVQVKERIHRAFAATGRAYAGDTEQRTAATLDHYAGAWSSMRGEVCATARRQPQRRETELRDACLDRRLGQLRAATTLLGERPDPDVLDRAISLVTGLPPVADCADVEALRARVRPPEAPALRAQVARVQPRIDRLEALYTGGKYSEAVTLGDALVAETTAVPYPELAAQVHWWLGQTREALADLERAKAALREGAQRAAEAHDAVLAAECWADILHILGATQMRFDEANVLRTLGPTLLAAAGDDRARRMWLSAEGLLLLETGKLAEAKAAQEQALSIAEKVYGPDHPIVAKTLNALAVVLQRMGDYPSAIAAHERALAIREKAFGPHHPNVAESLINLGAAWDDSGDGAHAREAWRRALPIAEEATGPTSRMVAVLLNNLAGSFGDAGQYAEAQAALERALSIYEKLLGGDHPTVAITLDGLASLRLEMGDAAQALTLYERAAAIQQRRLGADHPDVGYSLAGLGRSQLQLGRLADAQASLERARALREKLRRPTDDGLHEALLGLAELAVVRSHPDVAERLLQPLLVSVQPLRVQQAKLTLADALWLNRSTRARARALADEVRREFARIHHAPGVARAERWLAAHR